jgi:hypothetical protein
MLPAYPHAEVSSYDKLHLIIKNMTDVEVPYNTKHFVISYDTHVEADVGAEDLFDVLVQLANKYSDYKFFEIHATKGKNGFSGSRDLYVRFLEPNTFTRKLLKKIQSKANSKSLLKQKHIVLKIDTSQAEIYNNCYLRNANLVLNPHDIKVIRLAWIVDGDIDMDSYCFRIENTRRDVKRKLSGFDLKKNIHKILY